jgi:concanavalin A-like lectin/glucanase superfamily protein
MKPDDGRAVRLGTMNRAQTLVIAAALAAALETWLLLSRPDPGTGADPGSVTPSQPQVQAGVSTGPSLQARTAPRAPRSDEHSESRAARSSLEGHAPDRSQLGMGSGRGPGRGADGRVPQSARGAQDDGSVMIPADSEPTASAQGVRATPGRAWTAADTDLATPIPETVFESAAGTHFDVKKQIEVAEASTLGPAAGTLSFWTRPDWDDGNLDDATFVQLGDSGIFVTKVGDSLRFAVTDETGVEQDLDFPISSWERGHWRYIAATWDNGTYALYVDGKLIAEQSFTNPPDFQPDMRVYVGTDASADTAVAPAVVNRLTVLNRGVDPGEVAVGFRAGIWSPDK